jgi:dCTP diphosphatase
MDELNNLNREVNEFVKERDWDQFHNPKNLAMALSVEASELVEIFQWLDLNQSLELLKNPEKKQKVTDEIADIFVYLLRLSEKCDVDLIEAAKEKLAKNRAKYPAELVKGKAKKYDEY